MQKIATRPTANRLMGIESPSEARRIIRAGEYAGHTAGVAPDFVQGNLCILPKELALEFAAFCQRNPKPCPLIGMGAPGDPVAARSRRHRHPHRRAALSRVQGRQAGRGADRHPQVLVRRPRHLRARLLVLLRAADPAGGHPPAAHRARHHRADVSHQHRLRAGRDASRARWWCRCAPFTPADAIRAMQITSRFPAVHGAPVHIGLPEAIGIRDIKRPDFGDPPIMRPGELPRVLGLRGDAAGRHRSGAPLHLHHAQAGLDADHRQEERLAGGALTVIPEFRASEISGTQGSQPCDRGAPGSRLSALARSGRDDRCPYSRPINQP